MSRINACLWFDGQAEAAARFYVSLFENAKIGAIAYYGEAGPGPAGSVLTIEFELDGQRFLGLNGGPHFKFNEAVSFQISCRDQAEVDRLWSALCEGGEEGPCGWLKDRYGLSWQIVPAVLPKLIGDPDPAKAKRATEAMFTMRKLDIAALEAAAAGSARLRPPGHVRAADADVAEAAVAHLGRAIDVAQVHHQGRAHQLLDPL
jgi:predicted 3-demethylubiquinone-9 3-methyltransferase (glyoxalase superfamily)